MHQRALIMDITEYDGSYPADLLLRNEYELQGLKCRSSSFNTDRIARLYVDCQSSHMRLAAPSACSNINRGLSIIGKTQESPDLQPGSSEPIRGDHHGVELVACPRSGTRARG
jgi:hypothetical protein